MRIVIENEVTSFDKLTPEQYEKGLTKLEGNTDIPREHGERDDERGRYIQFFDNEKDEDFISQFEAVLNG